MACFYKRGKTWSFSIDVGKDKDGKRKKKGVGGFRTKKEAEEAAATLLLELTGGTYVEEEDVTFNQFSGEWLVEYERSGHVKPVKKGTIRIRKHEIAKLKYYFNLIKLKDITGKQYQDALYDLQDRGFAENTIAGVHGTARMIFGRAVELKKLKEDPTQYARPPRKVETLEDIENSEEIPKFLEKDELTRFLRIAHDAGLKDDYEIFLTLAYTGIRVGELCALKKSDLNNPDEYDIRITRTYYNPSNNIKKYDLVTPKTFASRRIVKSTERVFKALEILHARQNIQKIKNRDVWHQDKDEVDFVFTLQDYPGYPIYIKLVENRMTRLLRIAGLNQELTPHSLRHTHTSLLAEAGVSLEEIMERLGHENDEITRKVYLHVTKTMKKVAAQKFDQLMDSH